LVTYRHADFGFQTTLAGRGHLNLIRDWKRRGYEVHFFISGFRAISRVKERVLRGGHDIPIGVIRRRFDRSFRNFWNYYRQARSVIQIAEQSMYNAIVDSISALSPLKFLPYRSKSELPWPCRRPLRKRSRNMCARNCQCMCGAMEKYWQYLPRNYSRSPETNSTCWELRCFGWRRSARRRFA
jgi:hypothetical protein